MEQTNLTPEQYKTLAEFAGREVKIGPHDNLCYSLGSDEQYFRVYTPDTNDAQAFELLDKLLHQKDIHINTWETFAAIYDDVIEGGLTLNLAICHAVLALITENEHE